MNEAERVYISNWIRDLATRSKVPGALFGKVSDLFLKQNRRVKYHIDCLLLSLSSITLYPHPSSPAASLSWLEPYVSFSDENIEQSYFNVIPVYSREISVQPKAAILLSILPR